MTVLDKLATALNRRDEVPNQELAKEIARTKNQRAIQELVENLANRNRNIQSDCIKTLYEIGEREPALLARYYRDFGKLLDSPNNRLVWGAMTALDSIAAQQPKGVYGLLPRILQVADSGSVITRDHAVGILVKLATVKRYSDKCVPLLLEQLMTAPNNQFPMYAEMSLAIAINKHRETFQNVMTSRLPGLEKESQRKRVAKVLKTLAKNSA